jgi:hypothetical protein
MLLARLRVLFDLPLMDEEIALPSGHSVLRLVGRNAKRGSQDVKLPPLVLRDLGGLVDQPISCVA